MAKVIPYILSWDSSGKWPKALYTFYENGKRATEALALEEGLRRYPEDKYKWQQRKVG